MCSWGQPTGQYCLCLGPAPATTLPGFGMMVFVPQFRGLQPVPDEEVIDLYGGTQHIPLYQMSGFYGKVFPSSCSSKRPHSGDLTDASSP